MDSSESIEIRGPVLKTDEYLNIFKYLDFSTLKNCTEGCRLWKELIRNTTKLNARFCYRFIISDAFIVDKSQPPISHIINSAIKIEKLTFMVNFFDELDQEGAKEKLDKLIAILDDVNAQESIESFTIQFDLFKDTNQYAGLLFSFIQRLKNLKSLRVPFNTIIPFLDKVLPLEAADPNEQLESIETIFFDILKMREQVILANIHRMLKVFPNVKKIDLHPIQNNFYTSVIREFTPLIKMISISDDSKLERIMNLPDLKLDHYECNSFVSETSLRFLQMHPEIQTCSFTFESQLITFNRPYDMITDLCIFSLPPNVYFANILKWTPNIKTLEICFENEHYFGHEILNLEKLDFIVVVMEHAETECDECFFSMFQSFQHVKKLRYRTINNGITLKEITAIAENLNDLKYLEFDIEDQPILKENFLSKWPKLPGLKGLTFNAIGLLTEEGIYRLQESCPLLQCISLSDIRDSHTNELIQAIADCFPNIKDLTLYGDDKCIVTNFSQMFSNGSLHSLYTSATPDVNDIEQLFQQHEFLLRVAGENPRVRVSRRNYHEGHLACAFENNEKYNFVHILDFFKKT